MTRSPRRDFLVSSGAVLLALALPRLALAQAAPTAKNRALFQVTDNDPARWNMILNNMQNLREGVAGEAHFLAACASGRSCDDAVAGVLDAGSGFDLAVSLPRLLQAGAFTRIDSDAA